MKEDYKEHEIKLNNKIDIKMFGGFEIFVNGKKIVFKDSDEANYLKLIEVICLSGKKGITKEKLIENVFAGKNLSNTTNSLNNLIHQARNKLRDAGVPGEKYINIKRAIYSPEILNDFTVNIDVEIFKDCYKKFLEIEDHESKKEISLYALTIYTDELLPLYSSENWVIEESLELRNYHNNILEFLLGYFAHKKNYRELIEVLGNAVKIYPASIWRKDYIKVLILNKNYDEAYKSYCDIAEHYNEKFGVPVSGDIFNYYKYIRDELDIDNEYTDMLWKKIITQGRSLEGAKKIFETRDSYKCSFESFVDIFNVLKRNEIRRAGGNFLMGFSVVDKTGSVIENGFKLHKGQRCLEGALLKGLRQGDVFTTYGEDGFLVLLVAAKKEGCRIVYERIRMLMNKEPGVESECRYKMISDDEAFKIFNRKNV